MKKLSNDRRLLATCGGVLAVLATLQAHPVLAVAGTTPPSPQTNVILGGTQVTPQRIDSFTTASGIWQLDSLGQVAGLAAYRWTRQGSTGTRIMLCRDAAVSENGDPAQLSLQMVDVRIGPFTATAGVAPGACRIVEDQPLVEARADWVVQAVKDGRLPAYTRARSWTPQATPPIETVPDYDPAVIGMAPGKTGTPTSNANFVGVTSGQGGEYPASRGFLHNIDARIVDLALNRQPIGSWTTVTRYSWESLAQPQAARWSNVNHITADPQFPLQGDRPYATAGLNTQQHIDSLKDITGWQRDIFHLENTCYVHWLATADPVAGMCVQRQLAFALAEFGENLRGTTPKTYGADTGQLRAMLNMMSALWKSRDVASHAISETGTTLWSTSRIDVMRGDIFAYFDPILAPAPSSDPWKESRRISATLSSTAAIGYLLLPDGTGAPVTDASNFMLAQYGKEPLYLWARAGDPYARKWIEIAARHLAARMEWVGGAKGIDQCATFRGRPDGPNGTDASDPSTGSSYPVGPAALVGTTGFKAVTPPWTTLRGWANWFGTFCPTAATDRYDGAAIHTATQVEGLLVLARAAGVSGLDSAIARMAADKARTAPLALRYTNLNMPKHWAAPIEAAQ